MVIEIDKDLTQEFTSFDALTQDTLQVMLLLGKLNETIGSGADSLRVGSLFSDLVEKVGNHFRTTKGRQAQRLLH